MSTRGILSPVQRARQAVAALLLMLLFLLSLYLGNVLTSPSVHFIREVTARADEWQVVAVKNNIIYFKNGKQFKTPLYQLKYVGQLETEKKIPYLILSGRGCDACDANISIYIHSPSDGEIKKEAKQKRYSYPGKELYYIDRTLLYEARMFYGQVLPNVRNGVIWYQTVRQAEGSFKKSVYLIKVEGDNLIEKLVESNLPDISETFRLMRSKKCKELNGIEYLSEP